jgi:hypothetical protein
LRETWYPARGTVINDNASQMNNEVDFSKIKQKKVRSFVRQYGLSSLIGFARLLPICYDPFSKSSYHKHRKSFVIRQNIESVWNVYKTIHPREAWNGEMVGFGLQYSKRNNMVNYINDEYTGMEKGQIIILNLRLFWGALNIAVAHEVAEVNDQERRIKLCYMAGGASEGSQWIRLRETKEGFTRVSHHTYYKSTSNFRDTRIYPRFHTKAISEFHENVKKKAESKTT